MLDSDRLSSAERDLEAIKERVNALEGLEDRVEALANHLDRLETELREFITRAHGDAVATKTEVAAARSDISRVANALTTQGLMLERCLKLLESK
jgi:predicted RNase H-like nuclease (RuvC/YqgF family)